MTAAELRERLAEIAQGLAGDQQQREQAERVTDALAKALASEGRLRCWLARRMVGRCEREA